MEQYFAELGRNVLARWKKVNFSLGAFPEIAQSAMEEHPPAKHVDVASLVRGFLLDDEQPFQTQSGFGEPELVVYDNPRFYIQVLFWLDGTTDIHQHKFSGAFHVLAGSSIHSRFVFEDAKSISAHLRVGQLRMKDTHLLATGSIVPIISGSAHIHSLFHLETPSISVVIRTHSDPGTGPQFTYLPPHVAVDPFHHDALTTRRKQLLDMMETMGDPTYADTVDEMLDDLDFERGFFILQNCVGFLRMLGAWEDTFGRFRKKHGRLAAYVGPTLDEIIRRDALVELRRSVAEVEHRFFLAVLLNVPTRRDILAMIAKRHFGKATNTIMRWLEELIEFSEHGTWILDAGFSPDTPVAQNPEAILSTLGHFIEKGSATTAPARSPLSRAEFKTVRDTFLRSSLAALVK